jgi:hypothetical protein
MSTAAPSAVAPAILRRSLWRSDFRPLAVYGPFEQVSSPGKQPEGVGWQDGARESPPRVLREPINPRALNTGILCDGLRAIDIDIDDPDLASPVEDLARAMLGDGPVRERSNSGKRLILYRSADGEPAKRHIMGRHGKVEALGRGQQFVAYGVHPTGVPYEWRDGRDPATIVRDELTAVTEDQVTAFLERAAVLIGHEPTPPQPPRAKPSRDVAVPAAPAPPPAIGAREQAAFAVALDSEVTLVAQAPLGQRNGTLNTAAYNLGQMVGAGWGARGTVENALTEAALAAGLRQPEIRKTIESGLRAGIATPRPPLTPRAVAPATPIVTINGLTVDGATGEVLAEEEPEEDESDAPPIDEVLTHVGGVLGQVIDFIVASARRPNRRLALAAALPLCGTLIGRRMATPTNAGTHLYVIATYPTAGGKQHPIDAIDRLLRATNLHRHLGPQSFMSMSALIRHIQSKPLSICAQDEFGALLAKIGHPRASGHEQGISAVLRTVWGASFSAYQTPAYASASSTEILAPALSLFGPTTPQELYAALTGKDIVNGFFNRFLVIDGGDRVPECEPKADLRNPPAALVAGLTALYLAGEPPAGNLGSLCKNIAPDPRPVSVPWGDASAAQAYAELAITITERMDADPENAALLGRTAEIALRCATIRAVGDDPQRPRVTRLHMDWGAALALQSSARLIGDVARYMTDALGAAEFERKLLSKLRAAPGRALTLRLLHRSMQRHFRFANDLERALGALEKSGIIRIKEDKVPGGVRKTVILL